MIAPGAQVVRHSSGLELVGPVDRAPTQLPEALATAWSDALNLAQAYPAEFGYPYADRLTGTLVIRAASQEGERRAEEWLASGSHVQIGVKSVFLAPPAVGHRVERRPRSFQQLETIKHDLGQMVGIRGASLIQASEPDYRLNRVIFTAPRLDNDLISDLAGRYGVSDIAVRIEDPGEFHLNRHDDTSPFTGGAQINAPAGACTSGFSWYSSGVADYMISAGHCAPSGGGVSTAAPAYLGAVTSALHENWTVGTGTVYFTNQATYRGDLSAITVSGSVEGRMYKGSASTHTTAAVKEMWHRWAAGGDQYCTGGAQSGELCSYTVTNVGVNVTIGTGEILRNVVQGSRSGGCTQGNDSGGPVYTVRPDNGIAAKGIENASNRSTNCIEYFTDIWHAYYGLPGILKTQ